MKEIKENNMPQKLATILYDSAQSITDIIDVLEDFFYITREAIPKEVDEKVYSIKIEIEEL